MPADKTTSLSGYIERVRDMRQFWRLPEHKELWFRGEDEKFETILRPKLYRPPKARAIKPIPELLKIENDLYEDFQRCGFQLSNEKIEDEDWDWYFLMQHHGAPTRLLDWSDGALMALHFAVWPRDNKAKDEPTDAFVYVLEPDQLQDQLKAYPEIEIARQQWKAYTAKHPSEQLAEEEWERVYLPADEDDLKELNIPNVPLLLNFPHITRRVAAQRSRLMVFGTNPCWLLDESAKAASIIKVIRIDATSIPAIRNELRESGITESVIFPDLDGLGREMAQVWQARR